MDEIKSVLPNPAKQDFIAKAISSTRGGFHPSQTDLTARYSVKSIALKGQAILLFSYAEFGEYLCDYILSDLAAFKLTERLHCVLDVDTAQVERYSVRDSGQGALQRVSST